jgi:hypothetical protein
VRPIFFRPIGKRKKSSYSQKGRAMPRLFLFRGFVPNVDENINIILQVSQVVAIIDHGSNGTVHCVGNLKFGIEKSDLAKLKDAIENQDAD